MKLTPRSKSRQFVAGNIIRDQKCSLLRKPGRHLLECLNYKPKNMFKIKVSTKLKRKKNVQNRMKTRAEL